MENLDETLENISLKEWNELISFESKDALNDFLKFKIPKYVSKSSYTRTQCTLCSRSHLEHTSYKNCASETCPYKYKIFTCKDDNDVVELIKVFVKGILQLLLNYYSIF